jgi:hypothetical protein
MKKQIYTAPAIEVISVELEKGIAQSTTVPAGYGDAGGAGGSVEDTGSTTW